MGSAANIVTATTPFTQTDLPGLRVNAPAVVKHYVPRYEEVYAARGWSLFPAIDRVYVNARAREELGWRPRYDFSAIVD